MATKPKIDQKPDPVVLIEELARLIAQQSELANQVRDLNQVEKELFRVRGKRIGLLLDVVGTSDASVRHARPLKNNRFYVR